MAMFLVFEQILQGHEATEERALSYSDHVCFEGAATWQEIKHARHIETKNTVGIYYDYGADYYFFTDETKEEER